MPISGLEDAYRIAKMRGVPMLYLLPDPPESRPYGPRKAKLSPTVGGVGLACLVALWLLWLVL